MQLRPILNSIRSTLINPWLWVGLAILIVIGGTGYFVFNSVLMPNFTRHDVAIQVPDVINVPSEAAEDSLQAVGLRSEVLILRKPNIPRDVVIDQNPPPRAFVKPGRRVYLTVNTGDTTTVIVPRVTAYGIRQARNMLMQSDLVVGEVQPDSIPSFYEDIITLQNPAAGERVPPGTVVNLLYGTGLGDNLVIVPDITGLTAEEAQSRLLNIRLRSVVVGQAPEDDVLPLVLEQSPEPGTSVREGFEVRLRLVIPETIEN